MAYISNKQKIISLRSVNNNRPWYIKALSLFPQVKKVSTIDLGSGAGEFSQIIKPLVGKLTCVDFSTQYVNRLKKIGLKAIKADFNQPLPFRSAEFDLAFSLEVIEHLINHELFLREIYRLLKPKGYLIISTPNIAWWGYRLEAVLGRPPKKEGYHLRFFTYPSFIKLLQANGFTIIKSAGFSTIPLFNRLLLWLKIKPVYPVFKFWPNLLVQDLVFLCRKK